MIAKAELKKLAERRMALRCILTMDYCLLAVGREGWTLKSRLE
jgi:hypothetical protein